MLRNKEETRKIVMFLTAVRKNVVPHRARLLLGAVLLLGGIQRANGATITVGPGGAYDVATIQAGIDAANHGDTVLVAPGEYVITEPITFRGKAITVKSEAGRNETTIRMGTPADTNRGSVVIFEDNETTESVLDGFTITGGRGSQRSDPYGNRWSGLAGGGILCWEASPTIIACTINKNTAPRGAGITCLNSHAILSDCMIAENETPVDAGGVAAVSGSSLILTNCTIRNNSAYGFGGGLLCWDNASANLTNCIIRTNFVTGTTVGGAGYGSGLSCLESSSLILTNCNISENWAGSGGGGIQCFQSTMTIANCVISENTGGVIGGAIFCEQGGSATMTDCIVSGNSARTWGGGIECYINSSLTMTNCEVISNTSQRQGGGVECIDGSSATLTNCLIARNSASQRGGGLSCEKAGAFMTVQNCTIWGNSANTNGGGVGCSDGSSATVTNSIVWANIAPQGREFSVVYGGTLSLSYSNIANGQAGIHLQSGCTLDWGEGNIDVDPLFERIGYWDDKGTRDPSDDVWVEDDFHLKSQAARWDTESQTWVQDNMTSPCIDAGDPMSPIGWESFPNGGFVNMGAYGGTSQASKTYFGGPICETIVAGDINGDGQVNRADLEIMALHWTHEEPLPLP